MIGCRFRHFGAILFKILNLLENAPDEEKVKFLISKKSTITPTIGKHRWRRLWLLFWHMDKREMRKREKEQ